MAADHTADSAGGGGQFKHQASLAIVAGGELRKHLEGQGEKRIAGENGHGFAEHLVVGQLAAAVIVVIEGRQVVVN